MKCGRTACDREAHALLFNTETRLTYCPRCARLINETSNQLLGRDLIPWPSYEQLREHDGKDSKRVE